MRQPSPSSGGVHRQAISSQVSPSSAQGTRTSHSSEG
jgi:hypothetical protein